MIKFVITLSLNNSNHTKDYFKKHNLLSTLFDNPAADSGKLGKSSTQRFSEREGIMLVSRRACNDCLWFDEFVNSPIELLGQKSEAYLCSMEVIDHTCKMHAVETLLTDGQRTSTRMQPTNHEVANYCNLPSNQLRTNFHNKAPAHQNNTT